MTKCEEKAFRISNKDILEYIKRGPDYHYSLVKEFVQDCVRLTEAMGILLKEQPITAMIGNLNIEVIIRSGDDELYQGTMGGRHATEQEAEEIMADHITGSSER